MQVSFGCQLAQPGIWSAWLWMTATSWSRSRSTRGVVAGRAVDHVDLAFLAGDTFFGGERFVADGVGLGAQPVEECVGERVFDEAGAVSPNGIERGPQVERRREHGRGRVAGRHRVDGHAPVFPGERGGVWSANAFEKWRRRRFAALLAAGGLPSGRPYDLRHSFASLLLHEGRDVIYVARQLGHGDELTLADVRARDRGA